MTETTYRRHVIRVEPAEFGGFTATVYFAGGAKLELVEVAEPTERKALKAAWDRIDLMLEKLR